MAVLLGIYGLLCMFLAGPASIRSGWVVVVLALGCVLPGAAAVAHRFRGVVAGAASIPVCAGGAGGERRGVVGYVSSGRSCRDYLWSVVTGPSSG